MRSRRRNRSKYKNNVLSERIWRCIPIAAVLIGAVAGSIAANMRTEYLQEYIAGYITGLAPMSDKAVGLIEAVIKYGKTILCIWILGFIAVGMYVMQMVLFLKGFSYGFTTGVVLHTLGLRKGLACVMLYLPQSLLLIPLYITGTLIGINYIKSGKVKTPIEKRMYIISILPMMVVVMITGLMEVFALPVIL